MRYVLHWAACGRVGGGGGGDDDDDYYLDNEYGRGNKHSLAS